MAPAERQSDLDLLSPQPGPCCHSPSPARPGPTRSGPPQCQRLRGLDGPAGGRRPTPLCSSRANKNDRKQSTVAGKNCPPLRRRLAPCCDMPGRLADRLSLGRTEGRGRLDSVYGGTAERRTDETGRTVERRMFGRPSVGQIDGYTLNDETASLPNVGQPGDGASDNQEYITLDSQRLNGEQLGNRTLDS